MGQAVPVWDEVARPVRETHDPGRGLSVGEGELDLLGLGVGQSGVGGVGDEGLLHGVDQIVEPSEIAVVVAAEGHTEEKGDGGGDGHGGGRQPQRDDPAGGPLGDPGEVEGRGCLVEGLSDAVPHPFGGALTAVGEQRGRLPVPFHLGPATGTAGQVGLDDVAFVVVDGVQGERSEELLDVVVGEVCAHGAPIPVSTRTVRSRRRPERMRLLTVPSGSSRRTATSR